MTKRRQWVFIAIGVITSLVALRAALPWFVTRYVNGVLQEMPDYGGSVTDIDISLLRGAYGIRELEVYKVAGDREIPFIVIPEAEFSVEWGALLRGAVVGEGVIRGPTLNFIHKAQTGENVNWVAMVKELLPIRVNRLEVVDGTVTFYDFTAEPEVNLRLENLHVTATNFANVERRDEKLPAAINATAVSIGGGRLSLDMRLNPLKAVPDLDLDLEFENVNMPALNDFFRAYAAVDVEQGVFSVYSELAVNDGMVKGYIKPIAENVEILDLRKDSESAVSLIWQGIVDFVAGIFENEPKQQLATQIPLSGDLNNLETSVWVAIWNIFRNGFIEAFSKSTNDSIRFGQRQEPEPKKEHAG